AGRRQARVGHPGEATVERKLQRVAVQPPADLRLADAGDARAPLDHLRVIDDTHSASTSGPRSPVQPLPHQPGRRICAWLLTRLRPPALDHPSNPCRTNRAVGSAPGYSCGFDLRPSITRPTLAAPTGPSALRPATYACSTSGPRSPVQPLPHQPGRRRCALLPMRVRPPALDHPSNPCRTNRAVGAAPCYLCVFDLRPSITRPTLAAPTGPSALRPATYACST